MAGRFVVEGDRIYDTQEDRYYIRERIAVQNLNAKLERAAKMCETIQDTLAKQVRALKENE